MTEQDLIPTFAADGRRLRSYSVEAIERLLAMDKVVVRRNRRGKILCAQFRPLNGANPLSGSAHMGTYYSYEQHVADSYVWNHRRLPQKQEVERLMGERVEDDDMLDRYIRRVFLAVPLSILSNAHNGTNDPKGPWSRVCPRGRIGQRLCA